MTYPKDVLMTEQSLYIYRSPYLHGQSLVGWEYAIDQQHDDSCQQRLSFINMLDHLHYYLSWL